MKVQLPYPLLLILLAVLAIAFGCLSMLIGPGGGPAEFMAMLNRGDTDLAWMIVGQVRLPRTLLALMVGGTLGMAGAALQGYLRNPLADPGVVGVTSAASLGAVLVALCRGGASLGEHDHLLREGLGEGHGGALGVGHKVRVVDARRVLQRFRLPPFAFHLGLGLGLGLQVPP